jgi:hypothetical protein
MDNVFDWPITKFSKSMGKSYLITIELWYTTPQNMASPPLLQVLYMQLQLCPNNMGKMEVFGKNKNY